MVLELSSLVMLSATSRVIPPLTTSAICEVSFVAMGTLQLATAVRTGSLCFSTAGLLIFCTFYIAY